MSEQEDLANKVYIGEEKTRMLNFIFQIKNLKKMKIYRLFASDYLQEYRWIEVTEQETSNTSELYKLLDVWLVDEYYLDIQQLIEIGNTIQKQKRSSEQDMYHLEIHFLLSNSSTDNECFCAYLGHEKPAVY